MKSGLAYKVVSDVMFMDQTKGMAMRIQNVTFTKKEKNGEIIVHNAIKIQIWVTLIANLLLTIMQRSLHRRWSFSNLTTTVRITWTSKASSKTLKKTGRGCCRKPQSRLRNCSWSFRGGAWDWQ